MSTRICYMVIATLPTPELRAQYVTWLEDGHVDQVIKGGAHSAMIVALAPDAQGRDRVMTQYVFATRENFDTYVAVHAPALRAEGQRLFGPQMGVTMTREVGEIV
ncbi:MAG: DUF4286 family protein [Phycisphaerales bacterium]|nr:DUF4286 family protein [Phycisphaerales bacterium]